MIITPAAVPTTMGEKGNKKIRKWDFGMRVQSHA